MHIAAVAGHKAGKDGGRLRRVSSVKALHQLRNIDCLGKGLSHLRVCEYVGVVGHVVDVHALHFIEHAAGSRNLVHHVGVNAVDDVHLSVGESHHTGRVVGNGAEYNILCHAGLAPVILIALHHHGLILVPSHEFVGAGAAGMLVQIVVILLAGRGAHDGGA